MSEIIINSFKINLRTLFINVHRKTSCFDHNINDPVAYVALFVPVFECYLASLFHKFCHLDYKTS